MDNGYTMDICKNSKLCRFFLNHAYIPGYNIHLGGNGRRNTL